MKALLIKPERQTIEEVQVAGLVDIKNIIGVTTVASDAVGKDGDRLFFDEECFIRGTTGRYRIDNVIPVAGTGLLVGSFGEGAELRDVQTSVEDLQDRITYLKR